MLRRFIERLRLKAESRYSPSYWFLQAPQDLAEGTSHTATDEEGEHDHKPRKL